MDKKLTLVCITGFLLMFVVQTFACTTFLISGKYTADGRPMLFKNRDTDEMQNSLAYFTDGKYKYIGLVDGTKDWSKAIWGGYNETGFAIINTAAYNNNLGDTTKFMDQEGVVMKLALQTCQTLSDFEKLLETLPKPMGVDANFGVIDASGGAAYYETGNRDFKKYDANDPTIAPNGLLVRTNHSMRADLTKGFGFCRYHTAEGVLNQAAADKKLTPSFLFNHLSRNLTHSLTKTDLWAELPAKRDVPEFKFFIDYIPRVITSAAICIVGAKDKENVDQAMMWTVLGFPLTSVAIPVWIAGGENLPKAVTMNDQFKSPICSAALKFKEECFPVTYDRMNNYINLSAVINKQKTGYVQLLQPIESMIFEKESDLEKKDCTSQNIQSFYNWVDRFLDKTYQEQFNLELFKN
ncbi:MAG: carcinine hydrolase/isopenicillin-N N-acyltransferase family protein [Prolixibacteraceae bacterium]|nr:carcinine hydrolase/isopenicillin-N N-acyltransferase family protein [Prolixibacteraceae bacterium]